MNSQSISDLAKQLCEKLNKFHPISSGENDRYLTQIKKLAEELYEKTASEKGEIVPPEDLNFIINNINDGVCYFNIIYDGEGVAIDYEILEYNRKFTEIFNLGNQKLKGRQASFIFPYNNPFQSIMDELENLQTGESLEIYEDHLEKYIHIKPLRHYKTSCIALFTDLTDIKLKERKISQTNAIIESIQDPIMIKNNQGVYLFINEAGAKLLNKPKNEIIGRSDIDFFGYNKGKSKQTRETQIETPVSYEEEFKIDNEAQIFLTSRVPLWNETNKVGTIGICRNITQQKRAEKELFKREKLANTLFKITSNPLKDEESQINKALKTAVEMFGAEVGIISNITEDTYLIEYCYDINEYLHKGDSLYLVNTLCKFTLEKNDVFGIKDLSKSKYHNHPSVLNFGTKGYLGVPFYRKGKVMGTLNISSSQPLTSELDENEKNYFELLGYWIGAFLEKKQTEEEKIKQQSLFQTLFQGAPEAIVMVNPAREIQMANPAFEKLFGYQQKEVLGKPTKMLYAQNQDFDNTGKNYFNSRVTNNTSIYEVQYQDKHGNVFPSETVGGKIFDENNNLLGFMGLIRDISERKKAEKTIFNYNQQLKTKNKELEQFTYIAAHDLKEPLRNISNLIHMLEDEYLEKIDEPGKTYIKYLQESTNRMQSLIKALLDHSRLGQESREEAIDCNKIIEDTKIDLSNLIKQTNTNIKVFPLPTIQGYKTEIRLLFQNLINNGIKFRRKNSIPEIQIWAEDNKDNWQFAIKDNGIGISEANQEKVFLLFKRINEGEEREGTGIGLAHCKKIVELHNGKIWVESEENKGSKFYFTIPKS